MHVALALFVAGAQQLVIPVRQADDLANLVDVILARRWCTAGRGLVEYVRIVAHS